MKVQVIASGSSGNCYLISDSQNNTLIMESGKGTFDDALRQIADVKKIAAVIISHKHNDHFGDAEKWQKAGIKVYTPDNMEHAEQFNLACAWKVPFSVIPLYVEHDPNIECFAFFIRSNVEGGKTIFFATDCYNYSRIIGALPEPLALAMVEVNHDMHMLDQNTKYPKELRERIRKTHCSVQRASLAIQKAKCTRFLLIHPSENNLDQAAALEYLRGQHINREFQFAKPGFVINI